MRICVKYENSWINDKGRTGSCRKIEKWLPVKKYTGHIDLMFYVHILLAYGHTCARDEVFMIKPVARDAVHT